jgi:hypothetical protein
MKSTNAMGKWETPNGFTGMTPECVRQDAGHGDRDGRAPQTIRGCNPYINEMQWFQKIKMTSNN